MAPTTSAQQGPELPKLYTVTYEDGDDFAHLIKHKRAHGYKRVYAKIAFDHEENKELSLVVGTALLWIIPTASILRASLYVEHRSAERDDELLAETTSAVGVFSDGPAALAFKVNEATRRVLLNHTLHLTLRVVTESMEHFDKTALAASLKISDKWARMIGRAKLAVEIGATIAELNPIAKLVVSLVRIGTNELRERMQRLQAIDTLVNLIDQACEIVVDHYDEEHERFRAKEKEFRNALIPRIRESVMFLSKISAAGRVEQSSSSTDSRLQQLRGDLERGIAEVQRKALVDTQIGGIQTRNRVEKLIAHAMDAKIANNLPYDKDVQAGTSSCCLEGTRVELLKEIEEWASKPQDKRGLSLSAAAGKGKSAVAHSVMHRLTEKGFHAAFFAFDRTNPSRQADLLFPTLAYRLAEVDPHYHAQLAKLTPGRLCVKDIADQYANLVRSAFAGDSRPRPVIFIIDALDECPTGDGRRRALLGQLSKCLRDESLLGKILLFVTMRPDTSDVRSLASDPTMTPLDMDDFPDTEKDIEVYVEDRLHAHAKLSPHAKDVARAAQKLFQYAAVLCSELTDDTKFISHDDLLARVTQAPGELRFLYKVVLQSHFDANNAKTMALYRQVLTWVLLVRTPQQRAVFAEFARVLLRSDNAAKDVGGVLGHLGSLLTGTGEKSSQTVQPLHASFYDFVSDPYVSGPYYVDLGPRSHLELASVCFGLMRQGLCFNLCHLRTSFKLNKDIESLDQNIGLGLRYACTATASHLRQSLQSVSDGLLQHLGHTSQPYYEGKLAWYTIVRLLLAESLHACASVMFPPRILLRVLLEVEYFLQEKFLFWLEACSCLQLPNVLSELESLLEFAQCHHARALRILVKDCIKFYCRFHDGIMASAPQVYLSGLNFAPTESLVPQIYGPKFKKLIAVSSRALDRHWPAGEPREIEQRVSRLATRSRGHTGDVNSVAFSPDGRHIVSGPNDRTIRIWDAETREQVGDALEGHTNWVLSVAFSPDGRHIVSGSHDNTIRIWDVGDTLKGHTDAVNSVAFSPDGRHIVSGSHDRTIRIWDAEARKQIVDALKGHSDTVRSVAFSPDGRHIVSGSDDRTIRIWDTETREQVGDALKGHTNGVSSVAFSPDGRHIVSGSRDETIRIWDAETREQMGGTSFRARTTAPSGQGETSHGTQLAVSPAPSPRHSLARHTAIAPGAMASACHFGGDQRLVNARFRAHAAAATFVNTFAVGELSPGLLARSPARPPLLYVYDGVV
ncbi:hypothetical protein HDZ31DRAFT_67533 [Schizophyllum fasciatum]